MSIYNKVIDLQKLHQAWERVFRNKPAAGVDNVTYEQFDADKNEALKQLNIDLKNHTYHALPVRRVVMYKGEKAREIALYSMRDKVVQQSVAAELNKIYDNRFSEKTYAYRSNKSSLNAVNAIEEEIQTGRYSWILKVDIAHFFDEIEWKILRGILKQDIKEEDVLFLIEENVKSVMLEDSGELVAKRRGIYQGSGISPILSNIYMMDFDQWMSGKDGFYVRYSDDMMMLGDSRDKLMKVLSEINVRLHQIGLQINESKTYCVSLEEGADLLGYHFSVRGKSIPNKAIQSLQDRLETMWLTSSALPIEKKMAKAIEIIGGWEQYFREKRKTISIFEYMALVYAVQFKENYTDELKERRQTVINIYKDIALYLAAMWKTVGQKQMELLEYEQYYQVWNQESTLIGKGLEELLANYEKMMIVERYDTAIEIMQSYTDRGEYEKASCWMQKSEQLQKSDQIVPGESLLHISNDEEKAIVYNQTTAQKILQVFAGREDLFSKETLGAGGKRQMELQAMPLSEQQIMNHLKGDITIGTYIQRPNSTVKYMVIDVDISKKIMLQIQRDSTIFQAYLEKVWNYAKELKKILKTLGICSYIEYSGCRGYHVWTFFTEWIPVRYVNMLTDIIESKMKPIEQEEICVEFFPNKTRVKADKFGQVLKLPYGCHIRTGEQSYFLEDNGKPIMELNSFLDSLSKSSLNAVKKVLAKNTEMKEDILEKTVDTNLEAFGQIEEEVVEILTKCNLMRYLCQKAVKTGYLSHAERLSVLYVFGHLGDAGHEFVHLVMSHTLNYQYHTTERFIQRIPEKPVSCIKLREQYKQITAEYGCSCTFKRSKNCYPSPVLHAIALSNNVNAEVTLPTSRTMTKENEKKVLEEINIHKKAQELASRILELKKQKRGIDAAILKVEKELEKIYDNANVDCLEVEMGMLVRRKTEHGYEWLIEI